MKTWAHSRMAVVRTAPLLLLLTGSVWAWDRSSKLPRFEDYPVREIFTGVPVAPRLVTPDARRYSTEIREGVENGYGVLRDSEHQKGPNFAGDLIVIQWGCGAPCMRMAIVNSRTGEIYYPPISHIGVGTRNFDLPLLTLPSIGFYPRNPEVQFRLNSNLMILRATPSQSGRPPSYTYYFLWRQKRWTLLRRVPIE